MSITIDEFFAQNPKLSNEEMNAINLLQQVLEVFGTQLPDPPIEVTRREEDLILKIKSFLDSSDTLYQYTAREFGKTIPMWLTEDIAKTCYDLFKVVRIEGIKRLKNIALDHGELSQFGGWGLADSKRFLELMEWCEEHPEKKWKKSDFNPNIMVEDK